MRSVQVSVERRTTSPFNSPFRISHSALWEGRMLEHHIEVTRTARYFTLGESPRGVEEVWFACHGYAQLAGRFLEKLRVLEDRQRYVVAPEGLSRFYLTESPAARRVGASGMSTSRARWSTAWWPAYASTTFRTACVRSTAATGWTKGC